MPEKREPLIDGRAGISVTTSLGSIGCPSDPLERGDSRGSTGRRDAGGVARRWRLWRRDSGCVVPCAGACGRRPKDLHVPDPSQHSFARRLVSSGLSPARAPALVDGLGVRLPRIDPGRVEDALNKKFKKNLVRAHIVHDRGFCGTTARTVCDFDGGTSAVETLVVVLPRVRMQGIPFVADKVAALRRVSDDEYIEGSVVDCGAYGVDSWTAVRARSCEEPKTRAFRPEEVDEATPHGCELRSLRLEIPPRNSHQRTTPC